MAKKTDIGETTRIGSFEFKVVVDNSPVDAAEQRERRRKALTDWLLAEWNRQQAAKRDAKRGGGPGPSQS